MPMDKSPPPQVSALHEFFAAGPIAADDAFFGRKSYPDRRGFLRGAGLAAMAAMVGASIPFHRNMPAGLIPAAFAGEAVLVGKDGLTLLNDRPVNAETPPHLLDDPITPTPRHFIRNNGMPPSEVDPDTWTLTVDGLVDRPMTLSIADLRSRFKVVAMALAIECGGQRTGLFRAGRQGATSGPTARWPVRSGRGCGSRTCWRRPACSPTWSTPPTSVPTRISPGSPTSSPSRAACPSPRR